LKNDSVRITELAVIGSIVTDFMRENTIIPPEVVIKPADVVKLGALVEEIMLQAAKEGRNGKSKS